MGGICGDCACHFESRSFYKLHFLRLNLRTILRVMHASWKKLGRLGLSDIE